MLKYIKVFCFKIMVIIKKNLIEIPPITSGVLNATYTVIYSGLTEHPTEIRIVWNDLVSSACN